MTLQSPSSSMKGSCACGRIKFTATKPRQTVFCYCTTCRKCSGAAFLPFVHFHKADVVFETEPDEWHKSDNAARAHCSTCGSSISMKYYKDSEEVGVLLGCFDEGVELAEPVSKCIFVEEKPDWAQLPKDIPAFRGFNGSS